MSLFDCLFMKVLFDACFCNGNFYFLRSLEYARNQVASWKDPVHEWMPSSWPLIQLSTSSHLNENGAGNFTTPLKRKLRRWRERERVRMSERTKWVTHQESRDVISKFVHHCEKLRNIYKTEFKRFKLIWKPYFENTFKIESFILLEWTNKFFFFFW